MPANTYFVMRPRLSHIDAVLLRAASRPRRGYAFQSSAAPVFEVFNRHSKWKQQERAAAHVEESRQADYLRDEVAARLCERLRDIKREFPQALDLGANSCNIAQALTRLSCSDDSADSLAPALSTRIGHMFAAGSSKALLYRDAGLPFNDKINMTRHLLSVEESLLPFDRGSVDLVMSSLSMHWVNNLPGLLARIHSLLKPDCPFIGAMLGGDTLYELRTSLQLAEQERKGGISPHVSPLADVRDVGGLLQRAGFKMLTVDVDDIIVDYPDTFALMQDLQAMGENNAVHGREMGPMSKEVLLANEAIYRELHGNEDGTLPATFRVIYMIGWHESPAQSKPLPRGSGEVNLKDVLRVE